jgi:hypothetical protein
MEFIFPPSNDIPLNFSNALTYIIGQGLTLYWTEAPAGAAVSILLWQADPNTGVSVGDMEYVIRMAPSIIVWAELLLTTTERECSEQNPT